MTEAGSFYLAKRVHLAPSERRHFQERARAIVAAIGRFSGPFSLTPLAESDSSQTYRVSDAAGRAILKLLSPGRAELYRRAHTFFALRGIPLPTLLWADDQADALLFEDLGEPPARFRPDRRELERMVRAVARLHAAGRLTRERASELFPDLVGPGCPKPSELAASIVVRARRLEPRFQARLGEAAERLAAWVSDVPRLVVSDVKREHFHFRGKEPVLVDLEMVSFWDVPPANLATLLSFPGQFRPPVSEGLRRHLLETYADEVRRLEGTRLDPERLEWAVRSAEALLGASLAHVGMLDPEAWRRLLPGIEPLRGTRPTGMVRDRRLRARWDGDDSVETELGPLLFHTLEGRLAAPERLTVLDVGCGAGQAAHDIAHAAPRHRVIALDLDPGPGAPSPVRADAVRLPLANGSVDVLLAIQLLQYLPDKLAFLAEAHRVLAPGGLAVLAMTEHFGNESAFHPPLAELRERSPLAGAVKHVDTRVVGGRRILAFALSRGAAPLRFGYELVEARRSEDGGSFFPYLQSRYRPAETRVRSMRG